MNRFLDSIIKLYRNREESQRRNRANLAAHIAYTKRKAKKS
jgi:hypothetical protein